MLEYKGFKAQIDFDDEAGMFHGEVISGRIGICFSGRSVEELRAAYRAAVEEHLDRVRRDDAGVGGSHTGRFAIRVAPNLHYSLERAARRAGKSLHAWIVERLAEAARTAA